MKVTSCLYCGGKDLEYVTHRSDNNGILRCAYCGVMMVENLSDDTEKLYTADYFEKDQATKNGYTDYLSSPAANLIGKYGFTRLFAKNTGTHTDLGCADGSLIEIFASEGFVSRGLEISKDAVDIANAKGLDVHFSKLHKFPDNMSKSSVITAFDLLEHADRPGDVLREVYKNLDKDGYFVFSTLSVKNNDPSDYWFNHSLEHYVYYNHENLKFILTEVFGENNFAFVEETINGIAEFWGFAKKGKVTSEHDTIKLIKAGTFDKKDKDTGYLMSLFYNQVSNFAASKSIIDHFNKLWPVEKQIQAKFYNQYFQGHLEGALKDSVDNKHLMPAVSSIYWQALSHAEEEFAKIRQGDVSKEYTAEILSLREQLFESRNELHALKNSRVVGRVIKIRKAVGENRHDIRHAPRRALHQVRVVGAPFVPGGFRRSIKKSYKLARAKAAVASTKPISINTVSNQKWPRPNPLVSVVIPYYNRADTIDDTLKSLSTQTYKNFETIIVDDGSTEPESIQKLKDLPKDGLKAEIIYQKNQGVAAARNTGIERSKGKYIICLDSDDILAPTYIEKSTAVLETNPEVSLVTSHQDMFGVKRELFTKNLYDPSLLIEDNMVITAAEFRREGWEKSGGYTSNIGYEDWEFWLKLSEHGFWGKLIPEALFLYRTSLQSRYVDDKDVHWNHLKIIRKLHPTYKKRIAKLLAERDGKKTVVSVDSAFVNLDRKGDYASMNANQQRVLITIPWMTFGGAETLIYNYCREVKDKFEITFMTGLKSEHEWEYKFKEITERVYHLANLFDDEALYIEFISNYITTRKIDVLHIIHNGFTFAMLAELKKRHPDLKVALTMFNDRVEYFDQSIGYQQYINVFTSDNAKVTEHYQRELTAGAKTIVIPNGINCFDEFNSDLFDEDAERVSLGLEKDDLAVFYVGRLSEEKNPDVFVGVAEKILSRSKPGAIKFFVIGDGPMRAEVEKAIKLIGSDNITYLGYQASPARFLGAADVFVLPSAIEGFPLSILEAMAMNSVVVASDVGAVSQVIESGKDGYVVTPGSVEEIVRAVDTLRKDRELLGSMKGRGRKAVEQKYSNVALGENYRKLYESLDHDQDASVSRKGANRHGTTKD